MEAKATLALIVAIALSPVAAAWNQVGGDAERNDELVLAAGPLDILGLAPFPSGTALNPFWSAGALETPEGLVAVTNVPGGEGCWIEVYDDPLGEPRRRTPLEECRSPNLVAYDAATHAALICRTGTPADTFFEARDARDGSRLWGLDTGDVTTTLPDTFGVGCFSAALDEATREVFVPVYFRSNGAWRNFLVIADVDAGSVRSVTEIPGNPGVQGSPTVPVGPSLIAAPEEYRGITLTDTGVVLVGYVACGLGVPGDFAEGGFSCNEGVAAWLTRSGEFVGKERSVTGDPGAAGPDSFESGRGVSKFAAVRGATAAFLLGRDVVLLNPELPEPVLREPLRSVAPGAFPFSPPAVWVDDKILVALVPSITAVDARLVDQWSWTRGTDDFITDLVQTSSGQLLVTVESSEGEVSIVALDLASATPAFSLTLPFDRSEANPYSYASRILPLRDGRAVFVDVMGNRVLLGVAGPAELPTVAVSNAYPAPGEEVVFEIAPPPGVEVDHYTAFWGESEGEDLDANASVVHVFPVRADQDVRIVATLADGRTRTTVTTIHVGGTPPPELTTLQTWFAPENQNLTFGILGIVITVLGAVYTVGRHRRRLAKLERELNAVEEIRMLSVEDPRGAVLALKSYRDHLPEELARRRIDDSQYQILDTRSARLLRVLRTRMFSPYDARLSQRYHRLLDAAFEDAIIQPSERTTLVAALDHEPAVDDDARAAIVAILNDFTSARAETPRSA